jgi:hypothetical protein
MKKLMLLIALLGFFMVGMQSASAQWCFNVQYSDGNCDCGSISAKYINYSIYDLQVSNWVVPSTTDTIPSTNPFTLSGSESINFDDLDRYRVTIRISYYDPTLCCTDWDSDDLDGDELKDCEKTFILSLN